MYTDTHRDIPWILQTELGDVVHVEVKAGIDEKVTKGTPFAVVESVKAASDVYAPISGTIVEINETLDGSNNPELVRGLRLR